MRPRPTTPWSGTLCPLWPALALAIASGGCATRREAAPRPSASTARRAAPPGVGDPLSAAARAALGKDSAATLALIAMPHRGLARALGAHEVHGDASVAVTGVRAPRAVEEQLRLSVDAQGSRAGRKQTHKQHGEEFVWIDGVLYSRSRYGRFVRRRAPSKVAEDRADRTYGLLPAYIELLGRFIAVARGDTRRVGDRPAVHITLSLRAPPAAPLSAAGGPARRWRQQIVVKGLKGTALLDEATGAPLLVKLDARWTFVPPARADRTTGIPTALDTGRTGQMTLAFEQRVTNIGKVAKIAAPAEDDVLTDPRRLRLERERQFVAGERPLPKRWPRVQPLTEPGAHR